MATGLTTPAAELPLFDGFPYLVTRVMPTLYHHMLLPCGLGELELSLLHRAQWRANRLDVCLVVGPERALYLSADGVERLDSKPPRGGVRITGQLKPSATWPDTADLQARQRRLDASVVKLGYGFGDLSKGGRDASADDVARLAGTGPDRPATPKVSHWGGEGRSNAGVCLHAGGSSSRPATGCGVSARAGNTSDSVPTYRCSSGAPGALLVNEVVAHG